MASIGQIKTRLRCSISLLSPTVTASLWLSETTILAPALMSCLRPMESLGRDSDQVYLTTLMASLTVTVPFLQPRVAAPAVTLESLARPMRLVGPVCCLLLTPMWVLLSGRGCL